MKLNLGSADRHIAGYVSVDILPPPNLPWKQIASGYQQVDLAGPWPWPDSSVEEILAYDIIEHIGDCEHVATAWACDKCVDARASYFKSLTVRHPNGRIHVMNELFRVLVPGGRAKIEVPDAERGCGQWQDPQHVSAWCRNSWQYFEPGKLDRDRLGVSYGVKAAFRLIEQKEVQYVDRGPVWKLLVILEAVK